MLFGTFLLILRYCNRNFNDTVFFFFVTGIGIQLEDVESDLDLQQTQINNIAEEVEFHVSEITSLEENDITQDVRLAFVEDDLDYWDDKITALEVANVDITDRLITVEEILLREISNLKIDLNNIYFDVIYFLHFSEPWVACVSSPCENGGTCIDVNVDTFVCMCRTGYYGDTCQHSK